jgi:hypothetical protein
MARTLRFPRPKDFDAPRFVRKAKRAGAAHGVTVSGGLPAGRFEGVAEGTYEVSDREIVIVVEKKPLLVPWGMIEKALAEAFAS